jgi:putative transposase
LSIVQQCDLLGLARSSYYYEPVPESEENLVLMRMLDEQYTRTPFYGARKMAAWLDTQGYPVERKRVRRLLQRPFQKGGQSGRLLEQVTPPYSL